MFPFLPDFSLTLVFRIDGVRSRFHHNYQIFQIRSSAQNRFSNCSYVNGQDRRQKLIRNLKWRRKLSWKILQVRKVCVEKGKENTMSPFFFFEFSLISYDYFQWKFLSNLVCTIIQYCFYCQPYVVEKSKITTRN